MDINIGDAGSHGDGIAVEQFDHAGGMAGKNTIRCPVTVVQGFAGKNSVIWIGHPCVCIIHSGRGLHLTNRQARAVRQVVAQFVSQRHIADVGFPVGQDSQERKNGGQQQKCYRRKEATMTVVKHLVLSILKNTSPAPKREPASLNGPAGKNKALKVQMVIGHAAADQPSQAVQSPAARQRQGLGRQQGQPLYSLVDK
ncbi:hypothetical protein [Desulfosarcina cetonica]|uniref:hypothetical protein n=1 Tax=Desulfosarcina cetonica TaxID=90730 RepID=UPI001C464674|nr:hypothetical protein [Desulfosarcina cetonica]